VIVVGGGAAGLPTAIFSARRGAKVLLVEASDKLGGSLHIAQGQLSAAGYRAMIATTTQLNRVGPALAQIDGVHAITDVTGFGLLGHLLEMCRGAQLTARLRMRDVPLLDDVQALAASGIVTGASARNWAAYGKDVQLTGIDAAHQALLSDPQTSGGLLVACAAEVVDAVLAAFHRDGFAQAAQVGEFAAGEPLAIVE